MFLSQNHKLTNERFSQSSGHWQKSDAINSFSLPMNFIKLQLTDKEPSIKASDVVCSCVFDGWHWSAILSSTETVSSPACMPAQKQTSNHANGNHKAALLWILLLILIFTEWSAGLSNQRLLCNVLLSTCQQPHRYVSTCMLWAGRLAQGLNTRLVLVLICNII